MSGQKTKKVLVALNSMSAFLEFLPLMRGLKASKHYQPVFYLHRGKENAQILFLAQCQAAGLRYILGPKARRYLKRKKQGRDVSSEKTAQRLARLKNNQVLYFCYRLVRKFSGTLAHWQRWFLAYRLINKEKPDVIILDLGRKNQSLHSYLIDLAKKKRIPTIVQVMVCLWPFSNIPRFTGKADYIFVSSDFQKEIVLEQGIAQNRLMVTGQPSDDQLFAQSQNKAAKRAKLAKALGIASDKKIVLFAAPQYGEHNFMAWPEHWRHLEKTLTVLSRPKEAAVILSLHPRMIRERYQYLEKKFPVKILDIRCVEAIPLADIFVSTVSSMTRPALTLGLPVLITNPFGWDHPYKQVKTVFEAKNFEELTNLFERVLKQSIESSFAPGRETAKDYFGLLDGQAISRIIKAIDKLCF